MLLLTGSLPHAFLMLLLATTLLLARLVVLCICIYIYTCQTRFAVYLLLRVPGCLPHFLCYIRIMSWVGRRIIMVSRNWDWLERRSVYVAKMFLADKFSSSRFHWSNLQLSSSFRQTYYTSWLLGLMKMMTCQSTQIYVAKDSPVITSFSEYHFDLLGGIVPPHLPGVHSSRKRWPFSLTKLQRSVTLTVLFILIVVVWCENVCRHWLQELIPWKRVCMIFAPINKVPLLVSVAEERWEKLVTTGHAPEALSSSTVNAHNKKLVTFGGILKGLAQQSLHYLDLCESNT